MADWQRIVSRYSPIVWQTAYRLLGRPEEASDCFQETFLAALELSRRQKVRNWSALLRSLCTCRAMDQLRKRFRQTHHVNGLNKDKWSSLASSNPGPVELAQASELSARLRLALTQLPSQQAEVFCMRFLNDLSYRRIARQLGLTASAVGVQLHRARSRLRQLLCEANGSSDAEM